jgi:hypothetical protein
LISIHPLSLAVRGSRRSLPVAFVAVFPVFQGRTVFSHAVCIHPYRPGVSFISLTSSTSNVCSSGRYAYTSEFAMKLPVFEDIFSDSDRPPLTSTQRRRPLVPSACHPLEIFSFQRKCAGVRLSVNLAGACWQGASFSSLFSRLCFVQVAVRTSSLLRDFASAGRRSFPGTPSTRVFNLSCDREAKLFADAQKFDFGGSASLFVGFLIVRSELAVHNRES